MLWKVGRRGACTCWPGPLSLSAGGLLAQRKRMLMTIDAAIRETDPIRTISGLIFIPWVSSLKNVKSPALEAGIGALFFLLLIRAFRTPDRS